MLCRMQSFMPFSICSNCMLLNLELFLKKTKYDPKLQKPSVSSSDKPILLLFIQKCNISCANIPTNSSFGRCESIRLLCEWLFLPPIREKQKPDCESPFVKYKGDLLILLISCAFTNCKWNETGMFLKEYFFKRFSTLFFWGSASEALIIALPKQILQIVLPSPVFWKPLKYYLKQFFRNNRNT